VKYFGIAVGVALIVLAAASQAQLLLQVPPEQPGLLVKEAFASAYGQALADGLGDALRALLKRRRNGGSAAR